MYERVSITEISNELLRDMYKAELILDSEYFAECQRRGIHP